MLIGTQLRVCGLGAPGLGQRIRGLQRQLPRFQPGAGIQIRHIGQSAFLRELAPLRRAGCFGLFQTLDLGALALEFQLQPLELLLFGLEFAGLLHLVQPPVTHGSSLLCHNVPGFAVLLDGPFEQPRADKQTNTFGQ